MGAARKFHKIEPRMIKSENKAVLPACRSIRYVFNGGINSVVDLARQELN